MGRPTTTIFAMLEVLQDRGVVSAEELGRLLGIDVRTVRRYATALRELDIPVESVRGRYGGYRLAPGYRLPPLMLADDEAVAIATALAAIARRDGADAGAGTGPAPAVPDAADRALVKLSRVLPAALRDQVTAQVAASDLVANPAGAASPVTSGPEIIVTLTGAVQNQRRVRIVHERENGEPTSRQVDPYGLVVRGRDWYLVGHDHLRAARRVYRVDRITSAEELPYRFTRPEGYDPIPHVLRALRLNTWRHRVEVWLDTDLKTARGALPPGAGQTYAAPGGGVLLSSGLNELDGLARVLCGLPWAFVVHQPPELVDAVRSQVDTLTAALAASDPRPATLAPPTGR